MRPCNLKVASIHWRGALTVISSSFNSNIPFPNISFHQRPHWNYAKLLKSFDLVKEKVNSWSLVQPGTYCFRQKVLDLGYPIHNSSHHTHQNRTITTELQRMFLPGMQHKPTMDYCKESEMTVFKGTLKIIWDNHSSSSKKFIIISKIGYEITDVYFNQQLHIPTKPMQTLIELKRILTLTPVSAALSTVIDNEQLGVFKQSKARFDSLVSEYKWCLSLTSPQRQKKLNSESFKFTWSPKSRRLWTFFWVETLNPKP